VKCKNEKMNEMKEKSKHLTVEWRIGESRGKCDRFVGVSAFELQALLKFCICIIFMFYKKYSRKT
jgi:hypothetical protein